MDSIAMTSTNVILVLMNVMTMLLAQMVMDHTLVNVNKDSLEMDSIAMVSSINQLFQN